MSLLKMSFSGAVLILVIVVVRALLMDKLPKKTFLALWMVALVRLLVPFSLPSMASIYNLVQMDSPAMESVSQTPAKQLLPVQMQEQIGESAPKQSAIPTQADSSVNVWLILWVAGGFLCLGFFAVTYVGCYREFQMSIPVDNAIVQRWYHTHPLRRRVVIRQSDRISAPLSYGIVHPVILMPKSTKWENTAQLSYVLEHEYVHIRRFDAVTKLIVIAALCLHWFNPFVWVLYILFNRDIELSCDEAVVRRFGEHLKSAYAMTLIDMEEKKSGLTPFCNSFSKNAIEERIRSIMKIKKVSVVTSIFAVILVIGIASTFATSAAMSEPDTKDIDMAASGDTSVGYDREAITDRLTEINLFIDKLGLEEFDEREALLEEKCTLESMLEDLERQTFFETAYGDFGVSYQLPENRLYKDGKLVMSFYDEKNGGALWWDNDGEIYVEVIRNNAGEILRLFEGSAGEYESETNSGNAEASAGHEAVRDLVSNIAYGEQFPEYEKFGLSYDENNGYLMYDGKTVGYFKDEIKPGFYTRYSDETGELGVVVIRNEKGKILALQCNPAENAWETQGTSFEYRDENSDYAKDTISMIGGAEGPTAVFIAGKRDGSEQKDLNGLTEEEYHQYLEEMEHTYQAGISKTVRKNYTSEGEIPYALRYSEYQDGTWIGGVLKREEIFPIFGTELYQAVFKGELYEQTITHAD